MTHRIARLGLVLFATLVVGLPASARAAFDPRAARMERSEALFLEQLFEVSDEASRDNLAAASWLRSGGREGLHFEVYRERVVRTIQLLETLEAPERVEEVLGLVVAAVRDQRDFFADWYQALEEGRAFESQLTSEYGYHEGLHDSQRRLLEVYGRLLALFPREGEGNRRAFHEQLCALDLACGGAGR
ncbi:MAG: hypothetical protein ABFS46_13115 [Myxococcota bacterium]